MSILGLFAIFMLVLAGVGCALGIYDLASGYRFSAYINRKFGK